MGDGADGETGITTAPSDATGESASSDSATASDDHGDGEGGGGVLKFDVGSPDGGVEGCGSGMEGGSFEFSYIWIANTDEGTVSKIDTQTGVEQGRYATGPNHPSGSPSRTSVNQFGDAVVVNREPGGIAKIAATLDGCVDTSGDGVIQTSTGPADVLAYGSDECVLWYTDVAAPDHQSGPRPVAWEGVPLDENGCPTAMPRVWVAHRDAATAGVVWRLDGETGAVLDEVTIANWGTGTNRPYGGAVNADGDFWVMSKTNNAHAIRIDADTLMWEEHAQPEANNSYGMAVDQDGDPWGARDSGGMAHYHADAGMWVEIDTPNTDRLRGMQIDREGRAWAAGNQPCGLVAIDAESDTVIDDAIPLPGCQTPVGISIDVQGFVWVVDMGADLAYKVDPDTHDVVLTVGGLVTPYTYSDMTGAGLNLVLNPPG